MILSGCKDFLPGELFNSSLARQVIKIHERGPFIYRNGTWYNHEKEHLYMRSILALFNRHLVKVVCDSKHRTRHTVLLTDIGEHVARNLLAERAKEKPKSTLSISEKSQLFIAEITG